MNTKLASGAGETENVDFSSPKPASVLVRINLFQRSAARGSPIGRTHRPSPAYLFSQNLENSALGVCGAPLFWEFIDSVPFARIHRTISALYSTTGVQFKTPRSPIYFNLESPTGHETCLRSSTNTAKLLLIVTYIGQGKITLDSDIYRPREKLLSSGFVLS